MPLVKTHIHDSELFHDLKAMGRSNFSYEGAKALMEYLEELSEDTGDNIEYDPIAFCCDYAEYSESEYESLAAEYSQDFKDGDGDFDVDDFKDWLFDNTTVIQFNGGIIIQAF
jgi:NADH:ubiquinone oxidoreductase subunit E